MAIKTLKHKFNTVTNIGFSIRVRQKANTQAHSKYKQWFIQPCNWTPNRSKTEIDILIV